MVKVVELIFNNIAAVMGTVWMPFSVQFLTDEWTPPSPGLSCQDFTSVIRCLVAGGPLARARIVLEGASNQDNSPTVKIVC